MLGPELIRIQEKPLANWVTPAKVNAIRGETVRQCDKLDGLADGIINNYVACRALFDVKQGSPTATPGPPNAAPAISDPDPSRHERQRLPDHGQIATLELVFSRYHSRRRSPTVSRLRHVAPGHRSRPGRL